MKSYRVFLKGHRDLTIQAASFSSGENAVVLFDENEKGIAVFPHESLIGVISCDVDLTKDDEAPSPA